MIEEPWWRLRWKLCKIWHVPVDHEIFNNINSAQWLWYYHNFIEDNKEKFELDRDMIEYHASFIEPEAVKKIRTSREQSIAIPEEEFISNIERMFGRPLHTVDKPQDNNIQKADLSKILSEYKNIKNTDTEKILNYKDWLNIDLEK